MDYEKYILGKLIDKYENSEALRSHAFKKKISFKLSNDSVYSKAFQRVDEKERIVSVINDLSNNGIVEVKHINDNPYNNIEEVWLVKDMDAVNKAYARLDRIPIEDTLGELTACMERSIDEIEEPSDIRKWLLETLEWTKTKYKIHMPFTDDIALDRDILSCLVYITKLDREKLIRVMSTELYKDSKKFENEVKPKVLSVLKAVNENKDLTDEDLLSEIGIVRYPEIMSFRGSLEILTADGPIDYSNERHGSYINARTVHDIEKINAPYIRKVVTIENLANYVDYISKTDNPDELVIYHGGCYSPAKGEWLRKIHDSLPCDVSYRHWSDIDLGGFRIFVRLRDNIIPELVPDHMDIKTMKEYEKSAKTLEKDEYRDSLRCLLSDRRYSVFHELISYMLEHDVKLEQEVQIVG